MGQSLEPSTASLEKCYGNLKELAALGELTLTREYGQYVLTLNTSGNRKIRVREVWLCDAANNLYTKWKNKDY